MPYCILADIKNQFPEEKIIELTDDEGDGVVNDARVNAAIAKADREIDSYCGLVETVPFTTVPDTIKDKSVSISIYYLYKRRTAIPDDVKEEYKNIISWLKDIAAGKATIGPVAEADYEDQISTSHTEDDKIFSTGKKSDGSSGTLDNY